MACLLMGQQRRSIHPSVHLSHPIDRVDGHPSQTVSRMMMLITLILEKMVMMKEMTMEMFLMMMVMMMMAMVMI